MWFFCFVKLTALPVLWLMLRPVISGRRRRASDGKGILLVCNHVSMWDPLLLELLFPFRRIYFLTSPHLFDCPKLCQRFLRFMGAIPLERDTLSQLEQLSELLKRGEYVCFYPEGRISQNGDIGAFRPGFAITALAAGVPVTPIHICYSALRRAHISYGEPLELSGLSDRPHPSPEQLSVITDTVRDSVICAGKQNQRDCR